MSQSHIRASRVPRCRISITTTVVRFDFYSTRFSSGPKGFFRGFPPTINPVRLPTMASEVDTRFQYREIRTELFLLSQRKTVGIKAQTHLRYGPCTEIFHFSYTSRCMVALYLGAVGFVRWKTVSSATLYDNKGVMLYRCSIEF